MEKLAFIKIFNSDYTHKHAINLANKMNVYLNKEGVEKIKLQYGVEVLLLNISKLILLLTISLIAGILPQTLITLGSFNIIRYRGAGLHASNSLSCFISSAILFIPGVYMVNKIHISNEVVIGIFFIITILVVIYAPSDTEKKPIIGKKTRKKFKIQAILLTILLMVLTILIPLENIKSLIVFGALIEVVTILPLTYKILSKRRNNYERFEKNT